MNKIGSKIKALRESQGMSLESFAQKVSEYVEGDFSPAIAGQIENGEISEPSTEALMGFAKALNVPIETLCPTDEENQEDGSFSIAALSAMSPPLLKEVAFPGKFIDALSQEVKLTKESLQDVVLGTLKLMAAGLRIPCFSSHFTDDSKELLGYWSKVFMNGSSLNGLFDALNQSSRELVEQIDSSMVVEENVTFGTRWGVLTVPIAITRIDAVPQGAIVGTKGFQESFSRSVKYSSKKRFRLFAKESSMPAEVQPEEKPEVEEKPDVETEEKEVKKEAKPMNLMGMLGAAFGLADEKVKPEVLEKLFASQVLGLQDAKEADILEAVKALVKNGAKAMSAFRRRPLANSRNFSRYLARRRFPNGFQNSQIHDCYVGRSDAKRTKQSPRFKNCKTENKHQGQREFQSFDVKRESCFESR